MSVSGKLIEILPVRLPESGRDVVRLWVVARPNGTPGMADETCVYAEPQDSMPKIGDEIWWQSGEIYFDGDRQHLTKVGYSFSPSPAQASGSRKTETDHG